MAFLFVNYYVGIREDFPNRSKTQKVRTFYVCSGSATFWYFSNVRSIAISRIFLFVSKSLSKRKRVKIYLGVLRFFRYCSCRRLHHCLSFKVIFSEQWTWKRKQQRNEMKWSIWNNKSRTCQLLFEALLYSISCNYVGQQRKNLKNYALLLFLIIFYFTIKTVQ
jgi:hypothetical protein